jgi:DNA-binding transcriptional LysR family regulator
MDIFTLQCFIAVAETGSFTKAADRVGRSQSAISQQMAKLEETLGKTLFLRGKQLFLNSDGEIFLGYAHQMLALYSEALDRFQTPELEGEVCFGLPEDFASVFLADVLSDFIRIHPRIMLNVECDLTLNLFERFKQREFDLVLVKMNRPEDFPNGINVWSEPLHWVGRKQVLDEDKPVPLVLSPPPCVYRASGIDALNRNGRKWRQVFSSPSYASAAAAVRAGMGVGVMPNTMIPDDLHVIDGPHLPQLSDTHVSLLKHRTDNPAVNTLEEFVLGKLKH